MAGSEWELGLQERFYFGDTVLPLFESGIPLLKERLNKLETNSVTIAYPDEGAWKRFHSQLGEYPEVRVKLSHRSHRAMACQGMAFQQHAD